MTSEGLYSDPKLVAYRAASDPLPEENWLWPLYGAGFENLGRDGQAMAVEMPECGSDELLVRHDAVGLCFSDTKIIKAGPDHPRLGGRDMAAEPVVMGHEVALTVIQVGENRRDQFSPGDRFIVQADIYYKGVGLAYGYALQGGLSQYNIVGPTVLDGDEGCYLLPVQPDTGYAQAALTEPWACVTASYDITYRAGWLAGGSVLVVAGPASTDDADLGTPYAGGQPPARVVTLGVSGRLLDQLKARAEVDGFDLVTLGAPDAASLAEAASATDDGTFDDIVLLGVDAALYAEAEKVAGQGCQLNLVGAAGLSEPAMVDVGRLHYDGFSLVGTMQSDLSSAYAPIRTQIQSGGAALFVGAAGPMGQMHVQRALQSNDGPRLVVATDLVPERLQTLESKYASLIQAKRGVTTFDARVQGDQTPDAFNAGLVDLTGGKGYDDIVVLAPSARVVAGAVSMLADGATLNVFAGLARGTKAEIDLRAVVERGVRFTGTSGSAIRDLRNMLHDAESGTLDPNLSVVAVSGLSGVKDGLEGVVHQQFPGKVVIYPQIRDFPVTLLSDLEQVLPNVYAKLGPQQAWTVEAEAEFLKELLP